MMYPFMTLNDETEITHSEMEMEYFKKLVRDNAHLFIEFSQEGGVFNAETV